MDEKLRVECEFVGVVNGVPVTVKGLGHVGPADDRGQRRLDVELLADVVPFGFDPAFLALGAFDVVLLATAGGTVPLDQRLHLQLEWKLLDENYRDMGGFEFAGAIETIAGGLVLQGQFVSARTRMEPAERVASVGDGRSSSTVPLGRDSLVLTTASSFETSFGNAYLCLAVSRVVGLWAGWKPASRLDMRAVTVERAGARERDCIVLVSLFGAVAALADSQSGGDPASGALGDSFEIWSRVVDEELRGSRGDLGPVLELHASDDVSEELVSVQFPPLALGGLSELEDHREARDA